MTNKLCNPSSNEDVSSILDGVGLGRVEHVGVVAESEQQRRVKDLCSGRERVSVQLADLGMSSRIVNTSRFLHHGKS